MKQIAKRILTFSALILWMGVIFMFSAQNGEDSQKTSSGIVENVVEIVVEDFEDLPAAEKEEVFSKFSFPIRTLAHFAEFAILGVLALLASLTLSLHQKLKDRPFLWRAAACTLFCLLYACTDEIHQMFSDGRSAQLLDIGVDLLGSFMGIMITVGVAITVKNRKKERKLRV